MPLYINLLVLCTWIIGSMAAAFPWIHPSLEILDELNDAEIYKAVVSSVNDWERRQAQKKISNRLKREDTPRACYPDLGCFEASGPFGYLDTLPDTPEEINTKFLMFPGRRRRKSGSPPAEVPFEKIDEAFEWATQGFNSSLPTKVLIHGFGSDCNYIWVYEIRSALMAVEEVNIICVDWSNGATLPNYVKASANTRLVGKQLSLLLRGLVKKNGLSLKKTHLIGFSLGAHIAAFAGADLGNLSRITGLDPAGPLFESQDPRARLDQTDADFVDVIHSNGENLILGGLGSSQPMGHVDFYPNGGRMQKGCSHLFVGAVSDIIWSSAVEGRSLCNHRRAYKFFIDSVSPRCHFPAFPCNSYEDFLDGKCFPCSDERVCGNMGYYADRSKGRGQLYLITRDEEPFCAHQYHVKIESTPSPIPVKSYGKIQITLIGETFLNETFTMTKKDDEEMKLGESISRILVPHPILSQLTEIQILYTAYSGWLSSGLTQWKIDKVTLMDSFGKTSSVCKKNLILESGVPVTLPLYPGECNLPKNDEDEAQDRIQDEDVVKPFNKTEKNLDFIPTQVVKVGLEDKYLKTDQSAASSDPIDFYNLPWTNVKDNDVIDEAESSRAFNTRVVKPARLDKVDADGLLKEIVEPILRPHSSKNARSHDPERDKPEITEPILGPTTTKNLPKLTRKPEEESKVEESKFYDSSADWMPKDFIKPKAEVKRKREDESRILNIVVPPSPDNPIEAIATTVQFLPQRLARMFEEAERYARKNIFPLVSTYTPRFISEIIVPRDSRPKYIPLRYEASTARAASEVEARRNSDLDAAASNDFTTPLTNIQRIKKKGDKAKDDLVAAASGVSARYEKKPSEATTSTTLPPSKEVGRQANDDGNVRPVRTPNPLDMIISKVQVIPENIGKMFQQAERFTRENVIPFVSNLTPKFITDLFSPKELPRFIPFTSEESVENSPLDLSGVKRNKRNKVVRESSQETTENSSRNIQRIPKKKTRTD